MGALLFFSGTALSIYAKDKRRAAQRTARASDPESPPPPPPDDATPESGALDTERLVARR